MAARGVVAAANITERRNFTWLIPGFVSRTSSKRRKYRIGTADLHTKTMGGLT